MDNRGLEQIARETRGLTVRSIAAAGSGHPGGSLSTIDIMVLLHAEVMRPNPGYHPDQAQDLFILSAGHKMPALVSLWSVLGWIPEAEALSLRKLGSPIQGHPSRQHTPWCWTSTGSLGQGFGVAVGMAMAYKRQGLDRKVFVLLGDGECQEGLVTEAARIAAYYDLSNLIAIIDYNGMQSDRYSINFVDPEREFSGLKWSVNNCNGHNFSELRYCLELATRASRWPQCVVAETDKGYPIKYMMDDLDGYHGSCVLSENDLQLALSQLEEHYA